MGFEQARAKSCERCLEVINWVGVVMQFTKGGLFFVEKVGSHVILLYWETLLQVILSIYCKIFYQIPLFTILLLFSVFDKAKKPTQSVLLILTLNGLFRKIFRF